MLELNKESFQELIKNENKIIVIDFWAEWCGPCKMMLPVLESVSKENENSIIAKVNVDNNKDLAIEYGIRNIPTLLYFKNGEIIHKTVGFINKEDINSKINSL